MAVNGLTFDGFDSTLGAIRYRGPFGQQYALETSDISDRYTFAHGDRIRIAKGGPVNAPCGKPLIVVGVNGDSLWVHDEASGVALALRGAKNFAELNEKYAPELVTDSASSGRKFVTQFINPLGVRCGLFTDPDEIFSRFGVRPNEAYCILNPAKQDIIVAGVLFNCLWVTSSATPREAFPLVGATSESALINLYRLCERDKAGGLSPRMPVTPRTASRTAFKVDLANQTAECAASFGNKIQVSIARSALEKFNVQHGQRFMATKGEFAGKMCTIVGAFNGAVFVHFDDERKVTCVRNATNDQELFSLLGLKAPMGGATVASPPKVPETSPQRSRDLSPRSESKTPRGNFWIVNGRAPIDVSDAACSAFGFRHGDAVKCGNGPEKGQLFFVAGVHQGLLWVVPDGKMRAIPLRHCFTQEDVKKVWSFSKVGGKNLDHLMSIDNEPPSTPVPGSPRRSGNFPITPRGNEGTNLDRSVQETPVPLRAPFTTPMHYAASSSPPPATSSSGLPKVPMLNLSAAPLQQLERGIPVTAAVPSQESSSNIDVGAMPITRHFLKAFALFRMGVESNEKQPLAFQTYYTTDTHARLFEALNAMQVYLNRCSQQRLQVTNHVDEILRSLRTDRQLYA
jgi:hypothetical protein